MTSRSIPIVYAMLSMVLAAGAQEKIDGRRDLVSIGDSRKATSLAVVNGDLCFRGISRGVAGDTNLIPIVVQSLMFRRADDTLQAFIQPPEGERLKQQAETHLSYLTADYSSDPPRVKLTKDKQPTSRWVFEPLSPGPLNNRFYIRNLNKLDKPAWLVMASKGPRGRFTYDSRGPAELRPALLTFDDAHKEVFTVRRYEGPDGR